MGRPTTPTKLKLLRGETRPSRLARTGLHGNQEVKRDPFADFRALIIDRWQNFSGQTAIRVDEAR